jgi:hypothetical protein
MQTYLQQLLQDIAAAAIHPDELPCDGPEPGTFEAHIFEVERYLHDAPDTTLSQYTGLEKVQFPDEAQLSEEQCAAITKALKDTYFSYGVTLEIPDGIPVRVRYRTVVNALDEAVFVSRHGFYGIEYCHYDFDGYCPFGVERCPCYVKWEADVKNGGAMLEPDLNRLDAQWYRLLLALADARARFEAAQTPNRPAVQALCQQLEGTWLTEHRDDYSIWYSPEPDEVPNSPGRTLLGWAGFPDAVFPPFEQLHPLEAELLTLYMLRLLRKEYIFLSANELDQPQQYEALARHLSCELRKDESVDYFRFLCPPGQPHVYGLFKEEKRTIEEENWQPGNLMTCRFE